MINIADVAAAAILHKSPILSDAAAPSNVSSAVPANATNAANAYDDDASDGWRYGRR